MQVEESRAGQLGALHGRALVGERHQHAVAGVAIERTEGDEFERDFRHRRDGGSIRAAACLGRRGCIARRRGCASGAAATFAASPGFAPASAAAAGFSPAFGFGGGGGGNSMLLSSSTAQRERQERDEVFLVHLVMIPWLVSLKRDKETWRGGRQGEFAPMRPSLLVA